MSTHHTDGTWDDAQIRRFGLRVGLFLRRGLSTPEAEDFAEACLRRDADGDTRRGCIECQHRQGGGRCAAQPRGCLPPTLFHRCPHFAWQVPRATQ